MGVDLGGTKIEAALVGADGEIVSAMRVPTPSGDYGATIETVAALAETVERDAGICLGAIGVGCPGSLSPVTGLLRNANSTCLNGRPVEADLELRLNRPVRVLNDADCFALAEAVAGAGRGFRVVLGLILGTGVGSGFVIDGEVHRGRGGIAGEWGHTPLPWASPHEHPGPLCWCGRRGCIETWCSGPALSADHERATGERLRAEEIVLRAGTDPAARASLSRHRDRLGRGLAVVVDIVDPDVIVLGGGLSNLPGLADDLPALIAPHVFSDRFGTPVLRHAIGDSAGVIGAAWASPVAHGLA